MADGSGARPSEGSGRRRLDHDGGGAVESATTAASAENPPSSTRKKEDCRSGRSSNEPRYPQSAYDGLSRLQLLTFSFVTPTVKQGLRKPLQQEDVDEVRERLKR